MKIVKQKYIILLLAVIFLGLTVYWFQFKPQAKPKTVDPSKIVDAIKHIESEYPPRIGKTPTDEEIYSSSYIKRIRLALDEYLGGSTTGIEEEALSNKFSTDGLNCGLDTFDKTYYKSKFIILSASDNDYGGVQAFITFINKPDKIFWVWIYNDSYLRAFCEDTTHDNLINDIKIDIEDGKYPVTL